jgi:hypothetical protein
MPAPSGSAADLTPPNLSLIRARRTGPSYSRSALDQAIVVGGQSRHVSTSRSSDRPHRRHHGGPSPATRAVHGAQKGQPLRSHARHVRGKRTSRTVRSIGGSVTGGTDTTHPPGRTPGEPLRQSRWSWSDSDSSPEGSRTTIEADPADRGTG